MTRNTTRGRFVRLAMAPAAVACLFVIAGALGCTQKRQDQARFDSGLPTMRTPMSVISVAEKAGFLEATITMGRHTIWVYSAPNENCRFVFEAGEPIEFVDRGPVGIYRREGTDCQSLGFGNLTVWRDRSSRSTGRGESVIPRAQANFRVIGTYPDDIFLEGSFPLATRVGFAAPRNIVAIVPNDEMCNDAIRTGTTSMEFRGRGARAFTLNASRGLCDIKGFSMQLFQDTTPAPSE